MAEARTLVFPRAIAMGARPLAMPNGRAVLAVSAFFAFRLSDGSPLLPAAWYETVAGHAGPDAIPDSMAPLPGSELLVLGAVPAVEDREREVSVRCGSLMRSLALRREPGASDVPFVPGPAAAVWHADDNPLGRGGPEDDREPLIFGPGDPEQPVWLGPTPFDHPLRTRLAGTPDAASGTGWPGDADPAVFHEAHPAFWAESFSPGDPLAWEGLGAASLDTHLPPYRMTIVSGDEEADFTIEPARIHGVTVIPGADAAAVFWRAAIDVGDDIMGDSVQMLIVALEDADSPPKDADHWARIAITRWAEPETAMDDRPLLPAALAAAVALPFALPEDDFIKDRHAAAESWIQDESGLDAGNPFEGPAAQEQTKVAEEAVAAVEREDAPPPDPNDMEAMVGSVLAAGRKRHEEAGFTEPPSEPEPRVRGDELYPEIERRIDVPYQSPRDRAIVDTVQQHEAEGVHSQDVVEKIADARQMSPDPDPAWPPMNEEEAHLFGDMLYRRLGDKDLERHVDVAGAAVVPRPGEPDGRRIEKRRFDGVFAEDTAWENTVFEGCTFSGASFARARFLGCAFRDCEWRGVNLSKAEMSGCTFSGCTFAELTVVEPTWYENRYERCVFEHVSLADVAMRDTVFDNTSWANVDISDGLMMDMTFRDVTMSDVTLAEAMMPQNRFERVTMKKVWMTGKGPAGSVFETVDADTCGFLGTVRFDGCSFSDTRFSMTGFTGAVFAETQFSADCQFDRCDLSNAMFLDVTMEGIRFAECSMTGSLWQKVRASGGWFFGALLRGVDLTDADFRNAVFTDADLEGTRFQADKTIGADFRGTVRQGR